MKAFKMNTNTSHTHNDTSELAQEGILQLTQTRNAAMRIIAGELATLLPSIGKMKDRGTTPEDLPQWLVSAYTEAGVLDGSLCPDILREHLSKRTAHLVRIAQLGEGVTGESLARFLGLDLHSLANDGWTTLGLSDEASTGDILNV